MTTLIQPMTETRTTWKLDPSHSEVGFSVKHLMISSVRGRFAALSGTIVIDDVNPAQSSVDVAIETASIDTRQEQRDAHLRSADFFDAENYPTITFKSTKVEIGKGESFRLVGDLTIRGVTKEVVLESTDEGRGRDPWGGERAAFSATTKIDRRDFGLTWNQALETGGVLVANEIKITLDVQAVKA
jgi:polyisoprenoid-binding protein YceI